MIKNNIYEVLTTDGFKKFDSISETKKQGSVVVYTTNKSIRCTLDHKIEIENCKFLEASLLVSGNKIKTEDGFEEVIDVQINLEDEDYFYDLVDVEDTKSFYANGISVHNSISLMYLDEFAFIMPGVFDEFFASVYPTVASSKKSKIVMSSTPWGMNHFYKIWMDAENGKNGYTHFSVKWNDIPGRDEEYKEKTIAEVGLLKWLQEYEACVGPNTLIFIRDKETGEIKETEIYKMNIINAYFGCDRFEVLTPKGWSDFSGIRTVKKPEYLKIFFSDKSDIVVSLDHRFIHRGEEIFAFDLKEGDFLESRFNEKQICKIEYHNEEIEVYDLLNVAKDQHYYTEDVISHNCFLGSSNTLIDSNTLRDMVFVDPVDLSFEESFRVYAKPEEKHKYVLFCDVAEGLGGDSDYSTIQVIDVTSLPYKQVAVFENNTIRTNIFNDIIASIGNLYNEALIIVEANALGHEVNNNLNWENEYENLFLNEKDFGLKMTKGTKKNGCAQLKNLLESQKLILCDFRTITQFSHFIKKKNGTYSAEDGKKDDLVTPFILFAYFLSKPDYVENWLDVINIKGKIEDQKLKQIEEDLLPIGYINDGVNFIDISQHVDNDDDILYNF